MGRTRVIFDFPGTAAQPERLRFGAPRQLITAAAVAEVRPALRAVEDAARNGQWAAGFVSYEAAPAFDRAHAVRAPAGNVPLVWFAIFDGPAPAPPPVAATAPRLEWTPDITRTRYDDDIRAIRAAIAAGDVYQVNHTLRLHARWAGDPLEWYDALVARRHGRYHALIETPQWTVLSASPELFLDVRDRRVTTRPMKGTGRRGRWLQEDAAARARLAASPKDRAENLMIVDLLRNDLGRVARFGSVSVPQLFDVEVYPTVLQLTSTITAELRDHVGLDDIFAATFPCGSITGAPKFTAMRTIAQLESSPRGAYCGAIGLVRPDATATFNVAIRTVVIDHATGRATYGVGGGITWDSLAVAEYDEAIAKAALLHDRTPPFRLLETMRMEQGKIARLDRHLQRLTESAEYWGFCRDAGVRARAALERAAAAAPAGTWRVRLLADADGRIELQRTPFDATADAAVRDVALARTAVAAHEPLLQHKTSARELYDARRAAAPHVFDVLLYNEEGLITEFCTGNIVAQIDGALLTPPRACGLLAGTFRGELLDTGVIRERPLTLHDVRHATQIWLINSVREWVPVRLLE